MMDDGLTAMDELPEDLRRVLRRCDETGVGQTAAIHVDYATHVLSCERSGPQRDASKQDA